MILEAQPSLGIEDHRGRMVFEMCENVSVLERLGIHLGESELNKYKAPAIPCDFCGQVYLSSPLFIHDREIFLYMHVEKGTLGCYSRKEHYMDGKAPEKVVMLADIQLVERIKIYSNKQFAFLVETPKHSLRFYTRFLDLTEEWLLRLKESVRYCLIYQTSGSSTPAGSSFE